MHLNRFHIVLSISVRWLRTCFRRFSKNNRAQMNGRTNERERKKSMSFLAMFACEFSST